jgi:hypothetical protein
MERSAIRDILPHGQLSTFTSIHHNPVKHGLVANPCDWRWSSIHSYVRRGVIAADWSGRDQPGTYGD